MKSASEILSRKAKGRRRDGRGRFRNENKAAKRSQAARVGSVNLGGFDNNDSGSDANWGRSSQSQSLWDGKLSKRQKWVDTQIGDALWSLKNELVRNNAIPSSRQGRARHPIASTSDEAVIQSVVTDLARLHNFFSGANDPLVQRRLGLDYDDLKVDANTSSPMRKVVEKFNLGRDADKDKKFVQDIADRFHGGSARTVVVDNYNISPDASMENKGVSLSMQMVYPGNDRNSPLVSTRVGPAFPARGYEGVEEILGKRNNDLGVAMSVRNRGYFEDGSALIEVVLSGSSDDESLLSGQSLLPPPPPPPSRLRRDDLPPPPPPPSRLRRDDLPPPPPPSRLRRDDLPPPPPPPSRLR